MLRIKGIFDDNSGFNFNTFHKNLSCDPHKNCLFDETERETEIISERLMSLMLGHLKIINFPFVPKGKLMVLGVRILRLISVSSETHTI